MILPRRFQLNIGHKIYLLVGLGVIGLFGITFLDSRGLEAALKQQKQFELRHLTEVALGIVQEEYAAAQSKTVSEAEAQKRALARVTALRYGNGDYFFVQSTQGVMLSHPITQLVGKDMLGTKDLNGKLITVAFTQVGTQPGGGFVDFIWKRPGSEEPVPKLSFATHFAPWNWVISTGVFVDDLQTQTWAATERSLGAAALVMLITIAISMLIARGIVKPLRMISSTMKALADGSFDVEVPGLHRRDEIGAMAETVQSFKDSAIRIRRLEQQESDAQARSAADRQAMMDSLADDFERSVDGIVRSVARSAAGMQATAASMTTSAGEASTRAAHVDSASRTASDNVGTVAAAAEELSISVSEISRQVLQSTEIASKALMDAGRTNATVHALSQGAEKIGEVVQLIHNIAAQTNLLALNATIEAARAGESGRGFAVVASEVKALASQTAKATEDISAQVAAMQASTAEAVSSIGAITGTISQINEITTTISAAVEEQGAATQEIARNIQSVAAGSSEVSSHIGGVSAAAEATGQAASQVLSDARDLDGQSGMLRIAVDEFLSKVRAA